MLVITACTIQANGNVTPNSSKKYELMLNPKSLKRDNTISYDEKTPFGNIGINPKFATIRPNNLEFTFTIDGTGVVKRITSVTDEMQKLYKVIYNYDGTKHEPNHCQIVWGQLKFYGRLTRIDQEYTLFMPNGDPLRADVTLAFKSFLSAQQEKLLANQNSPDLSHIVEVRAGDTLPLLCYRIYRDSSYYREVARFNGLTNLRDLKPGTRLHFPPLR